MLTIKAEIIKTKLRSDGTYNVKLRFTKDRKIKRISTDLFIRKEDLNKSLQIKKDSTIYEKTLKMISHYHDLYDEFKSQINNYDVNDIVKRLLEHDQEARPIDFFKFSNKWIESAHIKSKADYHTAVNALKRYCKADKLNINDMDSNFAKGFVTFLEEKHENRVKKLKDENKYVPTNRATSAYIIVIRHLFNEAKKQYNNKEQNIIRVKTYPFDNIKLPRQEATRKRAISTQQIRAIWKLPYQNIYKGAKHTCRFDLAKDCFILSFCLIGINSVDLYEATDLKDNKLTYYRSKTKDRRIDHAQMVIYTSDIIAPIIKKYRDPDGKRVFNFYHTYYNRKAFNKALNGGLKEIGAALNIDDLEFYAARHSWATIAINILNINKYTVHAALNHIDPSMRVTDIYIKRNFIHENEANSKVIKYVFKA